MDHFYVAALLQHPCFFDCVFNLTMIQQQYYEPNRKCPKLGYCMEILMLLAKTARFQYTLLPAESWSHLNQLVESGAANFSLNLLTLREDEFSRYNFLSPLNFFHMGYAVHAASRTTSVESPHPFPPVAAFTALVWYLILTSFMLMGLLLLFTFAPHRNVQPAVDSLWYAFGLIFNKKIPETHTKTLKRIRKLALLLATTPSMFSFLLLTYFYADHIYGSLVAKTQKLDFDSTESLAAVVETGKRKLLFYSDREALLETELEKPSLPSYKKLNDALLKNPPKRFHTRDMSMVFKTGDKRYFVRAGKKCMKNKFNNALAPYLSACKDSIEFFSNVLPASTMAFHTSFTDSSCSTEFVEDNNLMAFMESAVVNKNFTSYQRLHEISTEVFPMVETILKRYFVSNSAMCAEAKSDVVVGERPSLNFDVLKPLLYLLAGGSCVGACCLLAELCVFKLKQCFAY